MISPDSQKKLIYLAAMLSLVPIAWCGYQSLKVDSILNEGVFESKEIAFKTAGKTYYHQFSDPSEEEDFIGSIQFGHWDEVSFSYDGRDTIEFHFDGQSYRWTLDELPADEWGIGFGESPVIYVHQSFNLEGGPVRIGTIELDSVRLESQRSGNSAKLTGQTTVNDAIYDVRWRFSWRSDTTPRPAPSDQQD